jgi:hypothetical protein
VKTAWSVVGKFFLFVFVVALILLEGAAAANKKAAAVEKSRKHATCSFYVAQS